MHDGGAKFEKSLDKDLTKFICEGAIENLQGKQSRFKPDASYSFHVNSLIFFNLDLIKLFFLIKANEALSLSEETSPEETEKTMAVALDPYTCEVVIKRLNVPGASGSS